MRTRSMRTRDEGGESVVNSEGQGECVVDGNPPKTPSKTKKEKEKKKKKSRFSGGFSVGTSRFYCHHCNHSRPKARQKWCCTCKKSYCFGCLKTYYKSFKGGNDIDAEAWQCPHCKDECTKTRCLEAAMKMKQIPRKELKAVKKELMVLQEQNATLLKQSMTLTTALLELKHDLKSEKVKAEILEKALECAVEMDAMKKKEEESHDTILSLKATLANVESQKLELEKDRELLRKQLLMVEGKEVDKKIIANMLDALRKCLQTFGPRLDEKEVRSILDEIKQVITASATTNGEPAEKPNTEKQVFYQVVQVLGGIVKTLKASFLPYIDELSSSLMPMLLGKEDTTAEERRIAITTFDDVGEECPEAEYHSVFAFWFSYYDTYLPSLLEACNDDNPKIQQGAVYGLGVCAEHGGSVIKPLIGEALSRLTAVISDPNALHPDNAMAYDNAVSALGKLLQFHRDSIDSAQEVFSLWLNCLPIKVDVIEAKAVHELLTLMVERSDAQLLGPNNENLAKVFSVFVEIMCAGKDIASYQTKCSISNLLRQFQKTLPPASVASIFNTLQPQQQLVLQAILSS